MLNKKEEYRKYVEPYLRKAYEECVKNGIPFFSSCGIMDDGTHTEYRNIINGSVSNGIKLSDDQFTRHINVSNGFDTYLNDKKASIDDDIPGFETGDDDIPELEEVLDAFEDEF